MWKNYFTPKSLDEALNLLDEHKNRARIIAGATDLFLEMEDGKRPGLESLIDITRIPNLDQISLDDAGWIHIGPLVTHNHCVRSKLIKERAFCLARACLEVGSPQIRNRATIAGNIVTASPANDTISPLLALNAQVTLRSKRGNRSLPLLEFFTGVRKTVMRDDELLVDIAFLAPPAAARSTFIKIGLRKAQAISVINLAMMLELDHERVIRAAIALGSVAPTVVRALKAEAYLAGKTLTEDVIGESGRLACESTAPIDDIRAPAWYRRHLVVVCTQRALRSLAEEQPGDDFPQQPVMLRRPSTWENHTPLAESLTHNGEQALRMTINGKPYVFNSGYHKTLLSLLREDAGLSGTKDTCTEGECGACTVIMDGMAVLSCLVPAPRAHNCDITTVEGLASHDHLHPIQDAFIREGGIQCGFCTPGFMLTGAMLLEEQPRPGRDEIKQAIAGNLCRCTGYYNIISAFEKAAGG